MTHKQEIDGGFLGSLRAAETVREPASRMAAGPFEVAQAEAGGGMTLPDALITGLLIVYPALATVVALVVGMSFSGVV